MHKPLHVRSVNEVQFEANMTFECAATRSLVADLLETIPKALNAFHSSPRILQLISSVVVPNVE